MHSEPRSQSSYFRRLRTRIAAAANTVLAHKSVCDSRLSGAATINYRRLHDRVN